MQFEYLKLAWEDDSNECLKAVDIYGSKHYNSNKNIGIGAKYKMYVG